VDFLSFIINRDKIIFVNIGFQGSFIAINEKSPGVIRVGRRAPGPVLPYAIQVIKLEDGRLCI
jgi:hypothetical protein